MRKYIYTTRFTRDLEKARKQKKDLDEIKNIMEILIQGKPLPRKNLDHPLKGNWKGYRECHVQNDLLLIYKLDNEDDTILFARLGTHSELFK